MITCAFVVLVIIVSWISFAEKVSAMIYAAKIILNATVIAIMTALRVPLAWVHFVSISVQTIILHLFPRGVYAPQCRVLIEKFV